jgi:hypothetical protein
VAARLTAVALLLGLLAAGCGGGNPSRRDEVSSYIDAANAVQGRLAAPARDISVASRALGKPHAKAAGEAAKLLASARTIDRLRRRLAAIAAPREARRLRALMLDLLRREAAAAREVAGLAAFLPAFGKALEPLTPAGRTLRKELAKKEPIAKKAAPLDAYAASVGAVVTRLGRLDPPVVSRAGWSTQRAALARVKASAAALAKAIRAKRSADLPKLLHGFDVAAASNQSLAAQRARIRAVYAYNARVRALDRLARAIVQERARLQRTLQ